MIKTYKKIAPIQTEQFDGSQEMIDKYKLEKDLSDGTDWYVITTLEGELYFRKGAWIATGINGEHWAIADDIFKATYEEV